MKRAIVLALAACAHAPTPQSILAEGREADAMEAAFSIRQSHDAVEESDRIDQAHAITRAVRRRHPGRLGARVLSADDIAKITGAPPAPIYGTTIDVVEVRILTATETYDIEGYVSIDVEKPAVTHATEGMWVAGIPNDTGAYGYGEDFERAYGKLWSPPPPPGWACVGGKPGASPQLASVLAGLLLAFTGVTPVLSILTGHNQIAPFFRSTTPGVPPVCSPPTDIEVDVWRKDPRNVAAKNMHSALFKGTPPNDRVLELFTWKPSGFDPGQSSVAKSLVVLIGTSIPRPGREPIEGYEWLRVPLVSKPTLTEQLEATFGTEGVEIATLEPNEFR